MTNPCNDGLHPSLLDVTLSGLSKEEIHKPKLKDNLSPERA
ncbi:hypothetical protein ADICYQ_5158 [Cyclobacterium qasimii M12-11B]|uniref:Uncharacterized protein n=1 Tax=Cyclobacterium qasimii M12-11B TaxID=641524 RepID=S7V6G5_9BACT|nr:hypothetical protein ADICYQ_5158 [Cyclobacterium qasimii M12-11B]